RNADTAANMTVCVNPSDVHWIEGRGLPNASTAGRNPLFTGWGNNLEMSLFKSFAVGERRKLELRWRLSMLSIIRNSHRFPRGAYETLKGRFKVSRHDS